MSFVQHRRSHLLCLVTTVLIHLQQLEIRAADEGVPIEPIATCLKVINLSPAEADQHFPVRLKGVVTCYIPGSQLCFIQDATAGIYVLPTPWPAELAFGDVVEVQGVTGSGRFSPIVQWATIRRTGQKGDVPLKQVAIEALNTGRFDSQWVQLEGVVQSATFSNDMGTLKLWTGSSSANVLLFGQTNTPANLVDATIQLSGVGGTFYTGDYLSGFGLFVPGAEHMRIISPAEDPFKAPLRTVKSLGWFSQDGGLNHRMRIQGVVTVAWPGEAIFLQDDSGAIRITAAPKADTGLRSGDVVQVAGFIRDFTKIPHVEEAQLRKSGARALLDPPVTPAKQLLSHPPQGQYVSTEGIVLATRSSETGITLVDVQAGNHLISAILRKEPMANLLPGSHIRLTGAWGAPPAELQNQVGPVLWLNSKAALTLMAPPRAGTISTPNLEPTFWFWIGGGFLAVLAVVGIMARRGRQSLAQLETQTEASLRRLADADRELHRLNEGRERLGRDLHDRIIQSIYAIGLNIDDCARSAQIEPGKTSERLKAALKDVNGVIGELRNVILGLETNEIQPREFRTALKSLALALGHEESNRIRLRIDDDALNALTPAQATELVHIAREAMTNSIRHGGAETTTFSLELRDDKIVFVVEDDGRGFNPKSVEGKGFGLRNMAKRSNSLGALFSIKTEEGHGTRVVLDIPRQKQHFSSNEPRTRLDR